ncbi:MAG: cytochrome P450 [Podila humilis]|nr:MAG: cytochrome P450 [Podila humilis]
MSLSMKAKKCSITSPKPLTKALWRTQLLMQHVTLNAIETESLKCLDDMGKQDLLQWFLKAKDVEGNHLSDVLIKDMLISITVAGRDTTVHSLSWMMYSLHCAGTDPEVNMNLVREMDNVLQDKAFFLRDLQAAELSASIPSPPEPKDLCRGRCAARRHKDLPSARIAWSSIVMGRSKIIWDEHAREFKRSRWINAEKPSQRLRVCLGQQFTTVETMTVVAMILSKFTTAQVNPEKHP